MNDRLKELCEHAKVYATECTKHFTGDEPVVWMDYYTEKFAQLIVRECANHCDLLLDHKISSEWSRGTHDCSKAIKKHFGVEKLT